MTISELAGSGKSIADRIPKHALWVGIVALSSTASFGLGILEGREGSGAGGVSITEIATTSPNFLTAQTAATAAADIPQSAPQTLPAGGEVVASKSGTKYYLPWCGTVKLIKDENKIWFASREAAEAAGYAPASNCKGL